jgi:hypothetical protein
LSKPQADRPAGYWKISELSFYLGKLHDKQPEFAEKMIQDRYRAWAGVYGLETIEIIYKP